MSCEDTTPVWKKLYHIVSGGNTTITGEIVEEILDVCKIKLVNGLLVFPTYTKDSLQTWKENPGLRDFVADDEMVNFINQLSIELDLDVTVAWIIICNFLMFEYFGKVDELKSIIRYDTNVKCLIENIWFFYTGDRMFMLKTLRYIFENALDKEHKFYMQLDGFMKSVDVNLLWKNLVKMFDNLINEIDRDKAQSVSSETLTRWIHRNNREQIEVLMLLIHAIQYSKLDGKELEVMLGLFIRQGFGRHPLYQHSSSISKHKDLVQVKYAEIACVLTIMERYWKHPNTCKTMPENIERNLELLQIQGDNSVVLFAWSVLKTSVLKSDEAMDYCNSISCELIKKRVFKSLHFMLSHPNFADCKSGDIVYDAALRLMAEFIQICADYRFLHEQIGICYVTSDLLRRKGLVALDYLGPIFQLSLDAFPFVFMPFLQMCRSFISIPGQYGVIMKLLKNIPSFLAEIPWNDHRERFHLVGTQKLFIDSDLFIIPEGTLVERFRYHGLEFARFIYPFSFFLLMEQFTKSLSVITFEVGTSWYCYENLTELVQRGFQFINHILKLYEGDFRSDTVLRTLIQRLEIVPTQFYKGQAKDFKFIILYFEINVTLITRDLLDFTEAFPPHMRKKFFPQITSYEKYDQQLMYSQMNNESILFTSLKEEESMTDHWFIIQYLTLIENMVERNMYHKELQVAGVWYILNVAFPLHQQWPYDDDLQMTEIGKFCISIFVKILKNHQTEKTDDSKVIYDMCCDAFMQEGVLIDSYISVFFKDKFFIQNVMEEESNWIKGPNLMYLENIRHQMAFLLLMYKIRAKSPAKKFVIDDKITIIAKAVSVHLVNPYNTSLRVLSCKFLEILARDENIPLMALLELDYDQIQRLFLDKLRDPMEDDIVKMHILDLISVCIFCQHGMTAAFFNVKSSRKWYSDNKEKSIEGDTVSDFMIDYLQNIRKSVEYLKHPLQVGILRVMANLWMSGKHHLINDVIALDAFWPLLADPLFKEYIQSPAVYAYIIKIFSLHCNEPTKGKKFTATIEKFIANDKQLGLWRNFILKVLGDRTLNVFQVEDTDELIKSWMEFLVVTQKDTGLKKFTHDKTKFLFIEMSLDGLKFVIANTLSLDNWINLCLIQISYWGLHFRDKDEIVTNKLTNMYAIIKLHYVTLATNTRSSVLTIVYNVLTELQTYFQVNTLELLEFLEQVGPLIDFEHSFLENEVWKQINMDGTTARELMIPWTTCMHIANVLLKYINVVDCALWFSYRNYLPNLVQCTCDLVNEPETLTLVKIAIYSLQLYVESPMAWDFVNVNMTKFFDRIEAPITALLIGKGNKLHLLQLEDGWVICTLLMKFNLAFLNKYQWAALPTCYLYMALHGQILQQILYIPESTVALKALDLLLNTLIYFDSIMVQWQVEWYRKSNKTYNFVVNGVKRVVNSCLYTILRPKNIMLYSLDEYYRLNQLENVPMTLMVAIMNKLITATGLAFSILYRTNPNLIDLMDMSIPDTKTLLIQNDFSVPKFERPIPYDLTYGKLLCLAHFMCKTLDALNFGHVGVIDELPKEYYSSCIALVEHQDLGDNLPNQKLSSFLRYAMYEYSGLSDPWINKLNYYRVKQALELLMIFLGQQVFLHVNTGSHANIQHFKRNLSSELQFFYEHIKRQTSLFVTQEMPSLYPLITTFKPDMDIIKRYLLYCKESGESEHIIENNFCLILSHWFTNICKIQRFPI